MGVNRVTLQRTDSQNGVRSEESYYVGPRKKRETTRRHGF